MNAATACRLKKEARALFPMWAAIAGCMILPFTLSAQEPLTYSFIAFVFGCVVLGPVCVGHEFSHGTISFLLMQPIPRRQLWREKLIVTGTALLTLSYLLVVLMPATGSWGTLFPESTKYDPVNGILFISLLILLPIMSFCTGPALTLIARNALGGGALTFICPQMLLVLGLIVLSLIGIPDKANEERLLMSYALVVGSVYSAGMFWFGRRQFAGLEDVAPIRRDVALPDSWSRSLAGLATRLLPEKRGITTSLIRKELRLQQPAFATAALLVAIWLAFLVVWFFRPAIGSGLMEVPPFLLCLGIPILLGSTSTAEERSLGIHDWHLTLPGTARRQWLVKVLIALILNVVIGLLLPWLLVLVTQFVAKKPSGFLFVSETWHVSVFTNLVILSAALHASTAARNTARALLGTIVLCIAGVIILSYNVVRNEWLMGPNDPHFVNWPAGLLESVLRFQRFSWITIWACLVGWFFTIGLSNFRYAIGSLRLPIQRLLVFFAVAWLLVTIGPAVWRIRLWFFYSFGW